MRTRGDQWPDWDDHAFRAVVALTVLAIGVLIGIAVALSLVG